MAVETFVPMLRNLSALLDKAAQHASANKLDPAELPEARLAPDMFPLAKQVQVACDQAKNSIARLLGQEPPRFADDEQTLDDLKARIAKTIDYVGKAPRSAFEGSDERQIEVPLPNVGVLEMNGARYVGHWG